MGIARPITSDARRAAFAVTFAAQTLFVSGCIMDGPFVDAEIDRLVSPGQSQTWAPAATQPSVTPLAIPMPSESAAALAAQRDAEASVSGAPLLVANPVQRRSLASCVDFALSNSPVTRGDWESARAVAATIGQADAAYYPDIGVAGTMGPSRYASPPFDTTQDGGSISLEMNWVLMDFGRRDADSARARAQLVAANYAFNRAMQQLVFAVQSAYFRLDAKISLREAAHENVATAKKQLEATDDRMGVGLATRPEVLQARQQYQQSLYDLEQAKAEVFTAQAALAVAMGLPADQCPDIVALRDLPLPAGIDVGVEAAIATALQQRPDIASAVATVRGLNLAVRRAEADFLPILSFEGALGALSNSYTVSDSVATATQNGTQPSYTAQLAAEWLLFDGYERANVLREARSRVREAEAKLEQLRLVTTGEIWASYFDFFSAQKQYEAGVALLTASQDSYDSVYQSYLNGLATINDLLLAESFLFDARFELIESRAQYLTASATFILALGS